MKHKSLMHELGYHLTMGIGFQPSVPPVTPLNIATEELERSLIERLHHLSRQEEHAGKIKILETRIKRLRVEIADLTTEDKAP
jgi:hypothetical protein